MSRSGKYFALLAASVAFGASPAYAQATRTWVSGVGDDANPCSRTAPCKTFAGTISKTAPGGEINCLDPGSFGTVTITKSITIDCTGQIAGQTASTTTGIIVNMPAGSRAFLRGITITGAPTALPGNFGIRYLAGDALHLEDIIIKDFNAASPNGIGILVAPTTAVELSVVNSTIASNGTSGFGSGIEIAPTNLLGAHGSARVALYNVRIINNTNNGIRVDTTNTTNVAGVNVTIEHSLIQGNATGLVVNTPVGTTTANVMLSNSVVSNNSGTGILASGGTAKVRVGGTSITGNGTGVAFGGGAAVHTYGTNRLNGNVVADGAFTMPAIGQQ